MDTSSASSVVSYDRSPFFFSSTREDAPEPARVSGGEVSTGESGDAAVG